MILAADEFIRRFLLHVLPPGLQRIRYYGFLGNRHRQEKLGQCRQLLQCNPSIPKTTNTDALTDYRDRYEALTGVSLHTCPVCRRGRMLVIEQLLPSRATGLPPVLDTS
jgi:Putative transposase